MQAVVITLFAVCPSPVAKNYNCANYAQAVYLPHFLAPSGAQGVIMSVRSSLQLSSFIRALNLNLSDSDLQAVLSGVSVSWLSLDFLLTLSLSSL